MTPARRRLAVAALVPLLAAAGCAGMTPQEMLGKAIEHQDAILKTGTALRKGFQELTPREEYYIGRAVAARILSQYKVAADDARTRYVNTLGTLLARASAMPETYGGWHFLLLDSDEVNAFAAPGGFIFVTTGLYRTCASEEQLAAVLAHEVGHVTLRHGLAAIKSARLTEAFTILGTEAAKEYGGASLAKLTEAFEGSINDIVNELVVSGYSRSQEYDADAAGARIAWQAGYDPDGLPQFLRSLDARGKKGDGKGFFSTHPPAGDRLTKAEGVIGREKLAGEADRARAARFEKYRL